MKRAILVSSGTLVSLVAALTYSAGDPAAVLASDGSGDGLGAPAPTGGAVPSASPTSAAKPRPGTKPVAVKPVAPGAPVVAPTPGAPLTGPTTGTTGTTPSTAPTTAPTKAPTAVAPTKPPTKAPTPNPTKSSTPTPTPPPTQAPGPITYVGSKANIRGGQYGDLTVSITVYNGQVTGAGEYAYHSKGSTSSRLSNGAFPTLENETIGGACGSVGSVSGASFTSSAWNISLQAACNSAGL